jgi:lipopolysaccharide heptosyltransferase II
MFDELQIYDPRERTAVGLADVALAPLGWVSRVLGQPRRPIERVLLLRLERIGDLLMVLDAIGEARDAWPDAAIDIAVGSWNAPLARLIPELSGVEVADVPWLARGHGGLAWPALLARARRWQARRYDLVVNFEPDIRSNLLAWLSGAPRRVGYDTGGGGAFLTDRTPYTPTAHVSENARRIVRRAAGRPADGPLPPISRRLPRLTPPADAIARAVALIGSAPGPLVGVHASGGRESKQWHLDRFVAVARELAHARGATIVLTGSDADRPLVDAVRQGLDGVRTVDAAGGLDLPALAALLARLGVLVTGDTGPMHLAAAMGTPVVALFGPSHPARYGPQALRQRILRVDLPCSPCGRVRRPPARCRGHVPDCMDGIRVDAVVAAALELLDGDRAGAEHA